MINRGTLLIRLVVILTMFFLIGKQSMPAQSSLSLAPTSSYVNASGTALFFDDFSDGNADGWTPLFDGTWVVDNGQYVVEVRGGTNLRGISLAGNTAWTDYLFEVDLRAEEGGSKIILFRYLDESSYYSIGIIGLELYSYYKVNLVKVENGVGTTLLNNDYPHDNTAWHHLSVAVQGNHIVATVDGDLVIDYWDPGSTVTHGRIGLQGFTGSIAEDNRVRFDNVSVWPLNFNYLPMLRK